ncbi:hypothetical protein BJX63DRAFT_401403 [Aspergillus granulosus]|uniref:Uncharacterized protein n=1 Tax=Aspergillus granulosus TaxID=176169 RepID=A0ABR4H5G6_9EURO
MHTSALVCFALALAAHAIPLGRPSLDTTIQRRSSDYEVVNVGGDPNPPQPPAQETVIETVTAPGIPRPTVTEAESSSLTATSTALWTTSTHGSSSSVIPTPTPTPTPTPFAVPVPGDETTPRGFTAMDRLARALGNTINSHLRARNVKPTVQLPAGSNGSDQAPHSPRGLPNATELGSKMRKARGLEA